MSFMKDFDHLQIQMKDIVSATDNFDPAKMIGRGGFGRVYRGELSLAEGQIMVAFKRLDRRLGQGTIEFWREIMMLSKYKHENLISLMHYCMEGDEMILVYEYASRGSLDRYLSDASTLTWIQRLRICVGAARGLHFLHDPMETQQRVLHRDIKSTNILLDEKWTAKVSDFGLSKLGPANQEHSYLISNAVGTPGYCDPLYWELGFLSKESDVYSFGVVLFEILCGRLCCEYHNGKLHSILVPKWRQCYNDKRAREERPSMAEIVKELEFSLEQQDILENLGKKVDFTKLMRIVDLAVPPLSRGPQSQLLRLLLKGFLVEDGETWISINMKGEFTKVVSANKCFFGKYLVNRLTDHFLVAMRVENIRCRFPHYSWNVYSHPFRVEVNTQFLSPHVTYTIYIVFKYGGTQHAAPCYIPFNYKLDGETKYSTSCIPYISEDDGWMDTSDKQGENKIKVDINLEQVLPGDFIDVIKSSKEVIRWTSNKELYALLRKGFLTIDGEKEQWFSISKDMKKRVMIPASTFLDDDEWTCNSVPEPESRFKVVTKSLINYWFSIHLTVDSQMLSPQTKHSCHLIYKLPDTNYASFDSFDGPMIIKITENSKERSYPLPVCLNTHCQPPIIGACKDDKRSPTNMKGHSKPRKDGWMEVQFSHVSFPTSNGSIKESYKLSLEEDKLKSKDFMGIVIEGIEFRSL